MTLHIFLRDSQAIQVPNFESFVATNDERVEFNANEIDSVRLLDDATYVFKGENTILINGKDILYLDIQ